MRENLKNLCAYVPEATLDEVKKKYDLKKVYRLSANENPYGTSKKVEEAVRETGIFPKAIVIRTDVRKNYNGNCEAYRLQGKPTDFRRRSG